jgi:hypothetical protein
MAERDFNVDEIMVALDDSTEELIQDVANAVLTGVTLGTPVGNPSLWQNPESAPPGYVGGHARRNWQVDIGKSNGDEIGGVDPSGGRALSLGRTVIKTFKRIGRSIFIFNNAPYIGRLNDGHSTQAPRMFVERAVAAGVRAGASKGEI